MSGTWLVSYGAVWSLLLMNALLTYTISMLLIRVRARWHNDARTFGIPFTGQDWIPDTPIYIDLRRPEAEPSPVVEEPTSRPEPETPSPAAVDAAVSRLLPATPRNQDRYARLDAVSVIIPTNDAGGLLAPCLRGLRHAQGNLRLQILCLFSEPPMMSDELCRRYGAEIIRVRGRFSYPRSVNVGLRQAAEPLVLLLHNDAHFVRHGDLQRMVTLLQENPQLAALGPVSNNLDGRAQQRATPDPRGQLVDPRGALSSHCLLLRREAIDSVGPMDERLSGYGYHEADWLRRAQQAGYRWAMDEATWVHHEGGSFGSEVMARGKAADGRYFREKWRREPGDEGFWDTNPPLVSIVMTAFNAEPWLDRCFGTILNSGLGDFEVVCVDDGSHDGTSAVIRHWSRLLPIRTARFSKAENVARAKNRALRMATGKYIAMMDADDEMPQERIPFLLGAIQETGADLVYGGFEVRPDRHATHIQANFVPADPWDLRDYAFTEKNWVCPCSTLFRREILDSGLFMDESLPAYEDYEWILAVGLRGYQVREAPGPSCHIYHRRSHTTADSYEWQVLRDGIRRKHGLAEGRFEPGTGELPAGVL